MQVLGFLGRAGSGKDTAADMLSRMISGKQVRLSFAQPLKDALTTLFMMDKTAFTDREKKETPMEEYYGKSPRELAQWLGTDIFRNQFDKEFWTSRLRKSLVQLESEGNTHYVLVTDVRFLNEAEMLLDYGAKLVYVDSSKRQTPVKQAHESEMEIDFILAKLKGNIAVLDNNGTLQELENNIQYLI